MSAVVEAVESVVDAVDKYVIQPIADDPLTFIATVAATYYLGPIIGASLGVGANVGAGIAAAAGNTTAGLAQGEDFDEAIKGGALAGVTTWAGSALAGNVGSTSTLDDSITAAGQTGTSTTGTAGTVATQQADEILAASTKPSSFNISNEAAKSWAGSGRAATDVLDDTLRLDVNAPPSQVPPTNTTAQYMRAQPNTASAANTANAANAANAPTPTVDATAGVYTGVKNAGLNAIDDSAALLDDAARLKGSQMPGGGLKPPSGYDLLDEGANLPKNGLTPSPMTKSQFGPQIEMLDDIVAKPTMWDKALGYGKDAYDWVGNNKLTTGATLLGLASLGGKDEPPDGGGGGGGKNEQIGDPGFYDPMRLYDYNRSQIGYGGDITGYGRTGGEHQFFTPTVYTPIEFATGGSVSPDKYGYYTYGDIPKTMRGFAQGGLSALAKGGNYDGRSDDIPAVLSDGEFVIDAETVALLGNGSSKAGANRLEEMRQAVRKQKGGALSRGQFSPDAKSPLAYLKSSKKSRG
jgi:hypothetical protein